MVTNYDGSLYFLAFGIRAVILNFDGQIIHEFAIVVKVPGTGIHDLLLYSTILE